jgi:hypothetical protein
MKLCVPLALKIQIGGVIAAAILSAACSTAPVEYKLQQDASAPSTNIAILIPGSALIEAVDGRPPPDRTWNKPFYGNKLNADFRIELAPGEHTLSLRYGPTEPPFFHLGQDTIMRSSDGKVYTTKEHRMEVRFLAEPGKTYTALIT